MADVPKTKWQRLREWPGTFRRGLGLKWYEILTTVMGAAILVAAFLGMVFGGEDFALGGGCRFPDRSMSRGAFYHPALGAA